MFNLDIKFLSSEKPKGKTQYPITLHLASKDSHFILKVQLEHLSLLETRETKIGKETGEVSKMGKDLLRPNSNLTVYRR